MSTDVYIDFNYSEELQKFQSKKRIGHLAVLSYLPYNLLVAINNIHLNYCGKMTAHCADEFSREIKRFEIYNQRNMEYVKELSKQLGISYIDHISSSQVNSLIMNIMSLNYCPKWALTVD